MKRLFAAIALSMMLLGAGTAFADENPSPEPETTTETEEVSPKTSDFNIVYVEGAGIILAGVAVVAAIRSRKHA